MPRMPRPRKPYVQSETSRHGKTVWYFRRGDGPRIRLPGEYESPEWLKAYDAAYSGNKLQPSPTATKGTLKWLVQQYKEFRTVREFGARDAGHARRLLDNICKTGGDLKFAEIDKNMISAGFVRREATPYAAINYVKMMSQLCYGRWRPTTSQKTQPRMLMRSRLRAMATTWTIEEVEQFQAFHQIGTRAAPGHGHTALHRLSPGRCRQARPAARPMASSSTAPPRTAWRL